MEYIVITLGIFLILSFIIYGHTVDCRDESEDPLAKFSGSQKILIFLFIVFCVIVIVWIFYNMGIEISNQNKLDG